MAQAKPVLRRSVETLARYLLYSFFLAALNFISSVSAANVDSDYKDALSVFQRRDIASCLKAIALLEKNLEQKADHLDSQALISYAYAHEAFILSQIGESGTDYQNSADAFSKAVLAQQPGNPLARKAVMLLQLMAGNHPDVRKNVEKDISDKETDADVWYIHAIVGDADKAAKSLSTALTLNADHAWIYSDMAFRAIKLNDFATAEKWIRSLEARRPGLAEIDLLRAVIAAQKNDKKAAQSHWNEFARKAPGFALVAKLSGGRTKK